MKGKHNGGFSLVECLVAISILALTVIPTCTGLIMSIRMNEKADNLMQAQLAVSSAVETLMAEGIPVGTNATAEDSDYEEDRFPDVVIQVTPDVDNPENATYYKVVVTSALDSDAYASTYIRAVKTAADEEVEDP